MNKKFLVIYLILFLLLLYGCSEKPISEKQKAINAYKEKQGRLPIINLQPEETREINEGKLCLSLTEEEIPLTFYTKGVEYASHGEFEEAKKQFNKALEIYRFDTISIEHLAVLNDVSSGVLDKDYAIYIFKGESHALSGGFQQAIAEFQKAIQINPNYARSYAGLGAVYFSIGQHQRAIAEFQKAVGLQFDKVSWYGYLGISYSFLGQYQRAIAEFQKAIQINPNYARSYAGLGAVYFSIGQHQRAIAEFQKAIQINPGISDAYGGLGIIYHSLGQYQKAIGYNQKAIQVNPGDGSAYVGLGIDYLSLGQAQQAIPYLQRSIQLNPYFIDAYYGIGFAYFSLAQYEEAQEVFQKLKEVSQSKGNHKMVKRAEKYLNKIKELAED